MSTAVIQIGNSDDKLTQMVWAKYVHDVKCLVRALPFVTHFFGASPGDVAWQNACWVVVGDSSSIDNLRIELAFIAQKYQQDSIAFLVGETEFIKG